jgi:hypothetical protein
MAYQRGSLKAVRRKEGETWVLRFRVTNAEGTLDKWLDIDP